MPSLNMYQRYKSQLEGKLPKIKEDLSKLREEKKGLKAGPQKARLDKKIASLVELTKGTKAKIAEHSTAIKELKKKAPKAASTKSSQKKSAKPKTAKTVAKKKVSRSKPISVEAKPDRKTPVKRTPKSRKTKVVKEAMPSDLSQDQVLKRLDVLEKLVANQSKMIGTMMRRRR